MRATLTLALLLTTSVAGASDFERTLAFEGTHWGDSPGGWSAWPAGTVTLDSTVVHGGTWSARIHRDGDSPQQMSGLTRTHHTDILGDTLRLAGWIRTEDVEGGAILWLRQDLAGEPVAFVNSQRASIAGTQDWQRVALELDLDETADTIVFGALLQGTGTAWFDDLSLIIDREWVDQAPKRRLTVIDLDLEFTRGSRISLRNPSPRQVQSLVLLGQVWGFLKYHHPAIASGDRHWDFELFRVLPDVLEVKNDDELRSVLLDWMDHVGRPEPCGSCAMLAAEDLHLPPPIDWIHDEDRLGPELAGRLAEVYEHRWSNGPQFYVGLSANIGSPRFKNELAYPDVRFPDPGFQLLALFRAWNVAQWWFPYRDLIDEDWVAVLGESIPLLMGAADEEAYARELSAFINRMDDGHAGLWSATQQRPPVGECDLPIAVEFVDGRAVVKTMLLPDVEEFRRGDVLLSIDGEPVEELVERVRRFHPGSNPSAVAKSIARELGRGTCGSCTVEVGRPDGAVAITTTRQVPTTFDHAPRRSNARRAERLEFLTEDIAYLRIDGEPDGDASTIVDRIEGTRALIIDARGYPAEFIVFTFGQRLVAERRPFVCFTHGDLSNPGAFRFGKALHLEPQGEAYRGRIVVLVDHFAQSSSEYHVLAFQARPGTLVIGSTTAGADGNVSGYALPGDHRSMVSGIGVFHPDRSPTQRVGIVPDVEVRPTVDGIRAGRDEVLEEALRQIFGDETDEGSIRELARRR